MGGGGVEALKRVYFTPKNTGKWGTGPKKGGSIDPLDPPILTGLVIKVKRFFRVVLENVVQGQRILHHLLV